LKKYVFTFAVLLFCGSLPFGYAKYHEQNNRFFFDQKVMAHAMGGMMDKNGNTQIYNNHEAALKQSIANGYKIIELDLILTKDQEIVCSHGWSEKTYADTGVPYKSAAPVMTYDEFMNIKIQGTYDTMDLNDFIYYVKTYKDIIWELDFRTISYDEAHTIAQKLVAAL